MKVIPRRNTVVGVVGVFVFGVAAAACGTSTTCSSPPATPTPPTAAATASNSPSPVASPTLSVTEFGFVMTLPAGIADATYKVDRSNAGEQHDLNGKAYKEFGTIVLTVPSFATDPACARYVHPNQGVAAISVFDTDPKNALSLPPEPFLSSAKVGQYWLGFSGPGPGGPTGCAALDTDGPLFGQAFATARPS